MATENSSSSSEVSSSRSSSCSPTRSTPSPSSSNTSTFPFDVSFVREDINRQLLEDFTGERTGFVQIGPEKWFLPAKYREFADAFYNFEVRPDDVWVVTYPRSGTTWTQELVWLIANDLDYIQASRVPQVERFPFFEFNIFVHDELKEEFLAEQGGDPEKMHLVEEVCKPAYESLALTSSRRFIKTHLPFTLLPPNLLQTSKVIYVARNPKDVAVSFYHLNRLIRTQGYNGDFGKYWDYFERNLHPWTPYWSHVQEGWDRKEHPNLLFLFYEDMNKDLPSTIQKVSQFFGKSYTTEQITGLADHLNISNFRRNSAVNFDVLKEIGMLRDGEQAFIRKGKSGSWREEFTPELTARADRWIQENLQYTDLRFPQV